MPDLKELEEKRDAARELHTVGWTARYKFIERKLHQAAADIQRQADLNFNLVPEQEALIEAEAAWMAEEFGLDMDSARVRAKNRIPPKPKATGRGVR